MADRLGAGNPCPRRPPDRRPRRQGAPRRADAIGATDPGGAGDVRANLQLASDFAPDGRQFDRLFADGEHFQIGGLNARVMATPGHTPACITYPVGDAAFIGDTLFAPDYGTARCDFPGGDARTLYRSIQRILACRRRPGCISATLSAGWPRPAPCATVAKRRGQRASRPARPKTASSRCARRATRTWRCPHCCCPRCR